MGPFPAVAKVRELRTHPFEWTFMAYPQVETDRRVKRIILPGETEAGNARMQPP